MLSERVKEWNKQSMERGMRKGMRQGVLEMFKRQLEVKFGSTTENITARIDKADDETISKWSERIIMANSLGEIFEH